MGLNQGLQKSAEWHFMPMLCVVRQIITACQAEAQRKMNQWEISEQNIGSRHFIRKAVAVGPALHW